MTVYHHCRIIRYTYFKLSLPNAYHQIITPVEARCICDINRTIIFRYVTCIKFSTTPSLANLNFSRNIAWTCRSSLPLSDFVTRGSAIAEAYYTGGYQNDCLQLNNRKCIVLRYTKYSDLETRFGFMQADWKMTPFVQ